MRRLIHALFFLVAAWVLAILVVTLLYSSHETDKLWITRIWRQSDTSVSVSQPPTAALTRIFQYDVQQQTTSQQPDPRSETITDIFKNSPQIPQHNESQTPQYNMSELAITKKRTDIPKVDGYAKIDRVKQYFTLRETIVNPIVDDFLITSDRLCEKGSPYILLVVPSIPGHFDDREAIRNTYGTWGTMNGTARLNVTMKVLFIVGKDGSSETDARLQNESRLFGDVVQANFIDSYKNLTRKILSALKWTTLHCRDIQYLLKIDEDVFVNLPVLLANLRKVDDTGHGLIYGHLTFWSPVNRKGKWAVTLDDYPLERYPPYATGNTYVITGKSIPKMCAVAEYLPYVPIEDAFVTGVLSHVIGIRLVSVDGFARWVDRKPKPCQFVSSKRVSATKMTITLLRTFWNVTQHFEENCT